MTTINPPEQAVDARPTAAAHVPISVNLLPAEIIEARAGRSARRIAIAALTATVVLVGAWYYHARQSRDDAAAQLSSAQQQAAQAAAGSGTFSSLIKTRSDITALKTQVCDVTTGTVAWSKLIGRIRSVTPGGVTLTGITANTTAVAAVAPPSTDGTDGSASATPTPTPSASPPNATPAFTETGTITIAGTEAAKTAAPAFANSLEAIRGLVRPYVTSVATDSTTKQITFSIQLSTDKRALSTRYCKAGK